MARKSKAAASRTSKRRGMHGVDSQPRTGRKSKNRRGLTAGSIRGRKRKGRKLS